MVQFCRPGVLVGANRKLFIKIRLRVIGVLLPMIGHIEMKISEH